MDDQLPSLIIIFTTFQERLRRTKTKSDGDSFSQQDLPSLPTRRWTLDIMSLVFVVFMGIRYCFCFHGCAYASVHNGNQVLANIGKEPVKKEVRMEFCPYIKKCHCTSTTNCIFSSAKVSTRSPRPPNASTGSVVVYLPKIPSRVHQVEKSLLSQIRTKRKG